MEANKENCLLLGMEHGHLGLDKNLHSSIEGLLVAQDMQFQTSDCLKNHEILPEQRGKMIDWMILVLRRFSMSRSTVFLSIKLMDYYFKCQSRRLSVSELHETGVVCMFIASKYAEKTPLKMHSLHVKIAHKTISIEHLKQVETEILRTVNYYLILPTVSDFLELLSNGLSTDTKEKAYHLAEIAQSDYKLSGLRTYELALSIVNSLKNPDSTGSCVI